jgi:hypothetical protein
MMHADIRSLLEAIRQRRDWEDYGLDGLASHRSGQGSSLPGQGEHQILEARSKEEQEVRENSRIGDRVQKIVQRPALEVKVRLRTKEQIQVLIWLQTGIDCRAFAVGQPGRRRTPSSAGCSFGIDLGSPLRQEGILFFFCGNELYHRLASHMQATWRVLTRHKGRVATSGRQERNIPQAIEILW